MTDTQAQIVFVPSAIARGVSPDAIAGIESAANGGGAMSAYVTVKNQIYFIGRGLSNNTLTWIASTDDDNGQPAYFVELGTGDNALYLEVVSNIDVAAATGTKQTTQFDFNGQTYYAIGTVEITYEVADYGWTSKLLTGAVDHVLEDALPELLTDLTASALRGLNTSLTSIDYADADDLELSELDEEGTEAMFSDAEIASISAKFGGLLGPVAAVGITTLIEMLLHYTQHTFTLVNLTKCDVTWGNPYSAMGSEMALGPAKNVSDNSTPDYQTDWVLPGGTTSNDGKVHYAETDFQFTTATELTGLGYVFTLSFTDPSTATSYSATFMFDLPWMGDNSLAATFGAISDYSGWYSENEGKNRVLTYTALSADGKYSLTLCYDLLSGTQPGPGDSGDGYFYNSLVVLKAVGT